MNADATLTITRDAAGRVLSETVNDATTTYTYDVLGRPLARTTPTGWTSRWTWDAAGQPVALANAAGELAFTHDPLGRETRRSLGPSAVLTQEWDTTDRLTAQTVTGPDRILQHRGYTYRPDGHLAEIRELTSGTRRFDLTPVGRVTAVRAHGWRETYAYDTAGNLTHATVPDQRGGDEREFGGTLIRRAGRTRYEHDAQGRLVRRTTALLNGQKREWTYAWNAEDRLTLATTPEGQTWAYAYDPLGRRTAKWRLDVAGSPTDRTQFAWDGTRLAEQTTPENTTTTWDHLPGTHRPVAQTSHPTPTADLVDSLTGGTDPVPHFHAIVTDPVGTPTELVTPEGHLAWQARTTLWGNPLPAPTDDTADCPLRFPGQYADPETGLHYNYFRYYDPEVAHYLSADPLGLEPSDNHHAYTVNPSSWIDPEGLTPCSPWKSEFDELPSGVQGHVKAMNNAQQMRTAFDRWTAGAQRLPARGPKIPDVYKLSDGTVMQWRLASKSGGETIDIFPSTGKPLKVHLSDQN